MSSISLVTAQIQSRSLWFDSARDDLDFKILWVQFVCEGAVGLLWFILWAFLAFDSPNSHPWISEQERVYITGSLKKEVRRRPALHPPKKKKLTIFQDIKTAHFDRSFNSWRTDCRYCLPFSGWLVPAVATGPTHPLASHRDVAPSAGHCGGPLLVQLDFLHPPHPPANLHERRPGLQHTAGKDAAQTLDAAQFRE